MVKTANGPETPGAGLHPAVQTMRRILGDNRSGTQRGIYAVCSAHPMVLEAAFEQANADGSLVLIEATCNQVNQEGGYTGLAPKQFRNSVVRIAAQKGFSKDRLILGGDHLGPNPWRSQPAAVAMEKAAEMVASYARAGFGKIHLDASMSCRDDKKHLPKIEIARRAASLCRAAEAAVSSLPEKPVYVIGTEVPTPGGARHELEIAVTTPQSLDETLDTHRAAFAEEGLQAAWDRVIAVVVQPGVEFGDAAVADYIPAAASTLSSSILAHPNLVFEAHSTDYQTLSSLEHLVTDHFGILKVGPELTFALREAVFGLAGIERECIPEHRQSRVRNALEWVMGEHPENWSSYYEGTPDQLRIARSFSLSDRIRYYWPNAEVMQALSILIQNLQKIPAPLPLIGQYLPRQAEAIRSGVLENQPELMIRHAIRHTLQRYATACN